MKTCKKCDISYEDDKKFCKKCGTPLEYDMEPQDKAKKEVFEDKIKVDPLNIKLLKEYAGFLFESSLYKESINVLLKLLVLDKDDEVTKQLLYKSYIITKQNKEVIKIGNQLLSERPEDISLLEELAIFSKEAGYSEKATEYYGKIQNLQPSNTLVLHEKALLLLENKQLESAIEIFSQLYNDGQSDITTRIYAGIGKVLNKEYVNARSIFSSVLSSKNISHYKTDASRGYLYMSYCLYILKADLREIDKWYSLINVQALKEDFHAMDEKALAETILYIITNKLDDIEPFSFSVYDFYEFEKTYLLSTAFYFTENTNSIIAQCWANVAKKQKDLNFYKESIDSFQRAIELMPKESIYTAMQDEVEQKKNEINQKKEKKAYTVIGIIVGCIVIVLVLVSLYKSNKQNKAWETAKDTGTYTSYQNYITEYPKGKHLHDAIVIQEEVIWKESIMSNTVESYKKYLSLYANGKYYNEALSLKEKAIWNEAVETNSESAYSNYISLYPIGEYASLARKRVEILKPKIIILGPGAYKIELTQGLLSGIYQIHPSSNNACGRYTLSSPSYNYEVWFTDGEKIKDGANVIVKWRAIPEFRLYSSTGDIVTVVVR